MALLAVYEGGDGVGCVPILRTADRGLLRIVAERVLTEAERAAHALETFDDIAALSARSEADAARACLEIVGEE